MKPAGSSSGSGSVNSDNQIFYNRNLCEREQPKTNRWREADFGSEPSRVLSKA